MAKDLKALIEDLQLNHEYCPKEVILQAADELERLQKIAIAARDMCEALQIESTYELWSRKLNTLEKLLAKHDS